MESYKFPLDLIYTLHYSHAHLHKVSPPLQFSISSASRFRIFLRAFLFITYLSHFPSKELLFLSEGNHLFYFKNPTTVGTSPNRKRFSPKMSSIAWRSRFRTLNHKEKMSESNNEIEKNMTLKDNNSCLCDLICAHSPKHSSHSAFNRPRHSLAQ